ncbi:hypothetical protein PoMZ_07437 [Pyricularia oryzae]|uniref:Uncharacterized protein n=1 Tax=Pyricularia oryzae TaxID=318829 RepID=A0A4P7NF42_PYROR|nr:hypothetical protein PoMZ_07437 [Pyricularia oryzae]
MFSMGNVKTLPAASQASAEGGSVGSTNMTGPETSFTASAETQLSSLAMASSSTGSDAAADPVAACLEDGASSLLSSAAAIVLGGLDR